MNDTLNKSIVLVLNRNWRAISICTVQEVFSMMTTNADTALEIEGESHLPHKAGLKLFSLPRAPKELPASALIRNAHGVAEWRLFLDE